MIGKKFSHYRIEAKVGEGGMGIIYQAMDIKLQRPVALKFLPPQLVADQEYRERFTREAQAAAALNHPNIITIYDIDEHEGQVFITMEYLSGQTLKEMINAGARRAAPLPIDDAINIAMQIGEGLHGAHRAGIIHRDIKPENILITKENQVKILDFGMAKRIQADRITKDAVTMGTLYYMSPEQLNGEEIDARTDIWSLGAVMYEMITAHLPFPGETAPRIVYAILYEAPLPIAELIPGIPNALERIVHKALAKKREDRYTNSDPLLADLRKFLTGHQSSLFADQSPPAEVKTIAVLPFRDLSREGDQEYLCDGIAEEIIHTLIRNEGMKVVARTSAFQFKGRGVDLREIGITLQVRFILEGSVRKEGQRLRITANLVRVADGHNMWSERFDRDLTGIFAIQDEITTAVVESLKVQIVDRNMSSTAKRHSQNIEAYNVFLSGRYFWNRRYEGGLRQSLDCFQRCIAQDPNYALPYVGIADSLNFLGLHGFLPPHQVFPQAKQAALRALELDANLAEPHASLGWIATYYAWNFLEAESEYRTAIAQDPNYTSAREWYSLFLGIMGRFAEATSEIHRALEIDRQSSILQSIQGLILIFSRQYEAAQAELRKTLNADPNFLLALIWLAETHIFRGQLNEAINTFEKALQVDANMTYALAGLGWALGLAGRSEEARKVLQRFEAIEAQRYVSQVQKAQIFVGLGQMEIAFQLLEKGLTQRDPFFLWFKVAPHFDALRSDPRFPTLLARIGWKT